MATPSIDYRTILGLRFFCGHAVAAVDMMRHGGLLVVPAAPALKDLATNLEYREALLSADLAITDSAFMVLVWNRLQRDHMRRLSGLEYLRELLRREDCRRAGNTLWVMARRESAEKNLAWLRKQRIEVPPEYVYVAPMYGAEMSDPDLLELVERLRPQHVVLTIGGGPQERLGLYLKQGLSYKPSIHCLGAAIAFLSGDQVRIPVWADKFYLGWLLRSLAEPRRYVPRYWAARKLYALMRKYGGELPPASV